MSSDINVMIKEDKVLKVSKGQSKKCRLEKVRILAQCFKQSIYRLCVMYCMRRTLCLAEVFGIWD